MAYQVIWAPSARLDLGELAAYIAESRPGASARFIRQIFQLVGTSPIFPNPGGPSPSSTIPAFGR